VRYILHADMDAFYASVEQYDNPEIRGKPVLVGGSPTSRGVVAAASYEARKFGVHSAMPMSSAVRRCPAAVIVRPRFDRYHEISQQIRAIFLRVTPLVEPLSLDEAYLDVTDVVTEDRTPEAIAREIKLRVKMDVGLTISVGVATCKSVAKVASDFDKPDGLTIVLPGNEASFFAPLPVGKLWGIGPKTAERLKLEGIHTIGRLAAQPESWFFQRFGKRGPELRLMAMGQDDHPVITEREAKSVSAETTLADDVSELDDLRAIVRQQSERVAGHLEGSGLQGKTVTLKLRLSDFTTFTRQVTVVKPVSEVDQIDAVVQAILEREVAPDRWFRLIGVGVSHFGEQSENPQLTLFGSDDEESFEEPDELSIE
jgi:DNA polymerase-4